MKRGNSRFLVLAALIASLLLVVSLVAGCADGKVSSPGEYEGYSSAEYTGYETTSQYVTMSDGTRIAVDVHRPTGGPDEKLPAILIMTPYHRADLVDGEVRDFMTGEDSPFRTISSYGYAIVVADIRGTGASFGTRYAIFTPEEVRDGTELIDWIVKQPWCDGEVGMVGKSYLATIQLMTASHQNPHLKCIIPQYSFLDLYDFVYQGGILNISFVDKYDLITSLLDLNQEQPALDVYPSKPVDEDQDGTLLAAATAEHQDNFKMTDTAKEVPFRDSDFYDPEGKPLGYEDISPSGHLDKIEGSGVAIYNMGGWLDGYVRETLSFQDTLDNPGKALVGNYDHTQGFENFGLECVRFFDRYLKGIDNGIDEEEPYYIYTTGRDEWRFSSEWPLPEQKMTSYYFNADGLLSTDEPENGEAADEYTVDYSTTSGQKTRWLAMAGDPSQYRNRANVDEKCLTYTTQPLDSDIEVTGHPVVNLYLSSSTPDCDLFVYLEDIDKQGTATYLTEGKLRASMKKLDDRPWLPALPFHRCYESDVEELSEGDVVELKFDILPTSHVFLEGHRIRVSIAGADEGNFTTPEQEPPPTLTVYRGGDRASCMELPIIE